MTSNRKKRAALCMSGQLRNLSVAHRTWIKKNLLNCNPDWEIDVFAHTWLSKEDFGQVYQMAGGRGVACKPIPTTVLTSLYKLYNPKKTLIEKQIDFAKYISNPNSLSSPEMRLSKMYSIKQSCLLKQAVEKEEGFVYDAVVMARFDIAIKKININDFDLQAYNTSSHASHAVDVTHAVMSSEIFNLFAHGLYERAITSAKNGDIISPDEEIAHGLLTDNNVRMNKLAHLSGYTLFRG